MVRDIGTGLQNIWEFKTVQLTALVAPLPSSSHHLSYDDCLEDMRENCQNCSVLCYGVERTNSKILSSHFFAISVLNLNYDVINDVISGFAKVVVERCGFRHWIAQTISWGEVVSVFLYLL